MQEFEKWLSENQLLKLRSSRDVCSRLKRVMNILNLEEINEETIQKLNTNDEFNRFSVSVKSQLRRAVKLYLKFINNEH